MNKLTGANLIFLGVGITLGAILIMTFMYLWPFVLILSLAACTIAKGISYSRKEIGVKDAK